MSLKIYRSKIVYFDHNGSRMWIIKVREIMKHFWRCKIGKTGEALSYCSWRSYNGYMRVWVSCSPPASTEYDVYRRLLHCPKTRATLMLRVPVICAVFALLFPEIIAWARSTFCLLVGVGGYPYLSAPTTMIQLLSSISIHTYTLGR